jgi:hypothetical protein
MMRRSFLAAAAGSLAAPLVPRLAMGAAAAPLAAPISASEVLERAKGYLGLPYRYGGTDPMRALDCSAYVSLAWAIPRQTTDTIGYWSSPIAKADLRPGDALNRPDVGRADHIRLFAGWATADQSILWVYEAAFRFGVSYHVVGYDDRYTPIRRLALQPDVPLPAPALPLDYDLSNGHFYSQTGGDDGLTGFAVTNAERIPLWNEFHRLGGVAVVGFPLTSRFDAFGRVAQIFQQGILTWDAGLKQATLGPLPDRLAVAAPADAIEPIRTPLLAPPTPTAPLGRWG